MDLTNIENALIKFLKDNILDESVALNATQNLNDIGVDSYSIVEIVLFIERKFGFIIPDSELKPEHFKNVASIAKIVAAHLSAQ